MFHMNLNVKSDKWDFFLFKLPLNMNIDFYKENIYLRTVKNSFNYTTMKYLYVKKENMKLNMK